MALAPGRQDADLPDTELVVADIELVLDAGAAIGEQPTWSPTEDAIY